MLADLLDLVLRHAAGQEARPIGDAAEQGRDLDQGVVAPGQVGAGARPGPSLGLPDQPGPHGVQLDVAGGRQQVILVHWERVEALLPKVAAPALAEVDAPGVAAVRLAEGAPQAVGLLGHQDQMDVVGHQAVGPGRDPGLGAGDCEEVEVSPVVVVLEEGLEAPVAPLGNVMRDARHHHPCEPGHGETLATGSFYRQELCILSPEFPISPNFPIPNCAIDRRSRRMDEPRLGKFRVWK